MASELLRVCRPPTQKQQQADLSTPHFSFASPLAAPTCASPLVSVEAAGGSVTSCIIIHHPHCTAVRR
jgi:hypothetical protein